MTTANMASGTTPPGTSDERQAAAWVQQMFGGIAPKYDLINHLLSFNVDRRWRRVLMRRLRPVLDRPEAAVLDLCCGTGDVLIDFKKISKARIIGADFCHPMLVSAKQKIVQSGSTPLLVEGDALRLPLANASLDAVAISFGFRNLANYGAGLEEFHRVLKRRGILAILEFSHPPGAIMKATYGFYSKVFMPLVGAAVSGSREAYTYLPDSIRKFPRAAELEQMMRDTGFNETRFELLTGGIAALHIASKSASGGAS
ncbi:MAG TPA: bifunctional demethylmenaquinone methyltransferase/2-methoxy-6-polyprenyl-1,4-benzoquinol methylase UbiE [Bryobacteraceae bacterium]|nr:bifunctional demethylmenaquinone methyltransferase/2-methoxy-6-polyprenyl-1,4-benzoquinol methylase UbiE [Bryobacteraceae bacterium]